MGNNTPNKKKTKTKSEIFDSIDASYDFYTPKKLVKNGENFFYRIFLDLDSWYSITDTYSALLLPIKRFPSATNLLKLDFEPEGSYLYLRIILVRQELIIRWIINQQQVADILDHLLEHLELLILMRLKKSQGMFEITILTYN